MLRAHTQMLLAAKSQGPLWDADGCTDLRKVSGSIGRIVKQFVEPVHDRFVTLLRPGSTLPALTFQATNQRLYQRLLQRPYHLRPCDEMGGLPRDPPCFGMEALEPYHGMRSRRDMQRFARGAEVAASHYACSRG